MSPWKVPDTATRELMIDFYRRILTGTPKADALREAQLELRKRYPHPGDWGAFICQGDPGPYIDNLVHPSDWTISIEWIFPVGDLNPGYLSGDRFRLPVLVDFKPDVRQHLGNFFNRIKVLLPGFLR